MERRTRKIIEIDESLCDGCGRCVVGCAEGALAIVAGKAKIVSESYCDGLGACVGECPTGALRIVEREAAPFDEGAVKEHLAQQARGVLPCGCPSTLTQIFEKPAFCPTDGPVPPPSAPEVSALSHWPVKIKLIPPTAPFLRGADLLVLADCTAVAYPSLHRDLIRGKVVMMGCPKFDDLQAYVEKFAHIFRINEIQDVTVVVMEVPCCGGLPRIVQRGMAMAGKEIPLKETVLTLKGEIKSS